MGDSVLDKSYVSLQKIRSYIVKLNYERRKTPIFDQKLNEAKAIYLEVKREVSSINQKIDNSELDDSEIRLVNELLVKINKLYDEILNFKDKQTEAAEMASFDLKVAVSLLPIMDDSENTTQKLIDAIELYDSMLNNEVNDLLGDIKKHFLTIKSDSALQLKLFRSKQGDKSIESFGKDLKELFVNLTISQAKEDENAYNVLKPINERLALKQFTDGLRNQRLSTIMASRNFSYLKDAIRAAQDEETTFFNSNPQIYTASRRGQGRFMRNSMRGSSQNRGVNFKNLTRVSVINEMLEHGSNRAFTLEALPFISKTATRAVASSVSPLDASDEHTGYDVSLVSSHDECLNPVGADMESVFKLINLNDSLESPRKLPISVDWDKCFICQEHTKEEVVKPSNSKRVANDAFTSLASNLESFASLGCLPKEVNLAVLKGLEKNLRANSAVYHKPCALKYNKTKLERATDKRKLGQENVPPTSPLKTRKTLSLSPYEKDTCFFCGLGSSKFWPLSRVMDEGEKVIINCAKELRDSKILTMSQGLCGLRLMNYHKKCYTNYVNRCRPPKSNKTESNGMAHGVVLARLTSHMNEVRAESTQPPAFKISELTRIYASEIEQLGASCDVHSTRLRERILMECPDLESSGRSGQDILIAFKRDIDWTMTED
ncbi:unnamed protein product [Ceutorhynchus assimilis]|uniref:Uncharacterized protein n=1 Tax=Ceutorhynchus assimilis TaxID=467358 RepID=A0A9N9MIV9_9CUCU|nr:unnamed protein product [Ceutorhynchus assimilis]